MKVTAGKYEVYALSFEEAEDFTHDRHYIVVSVLDRDWPLPELQNDPRRLEHIHIACASELSEQEANKLFNTLNRHKEDGIMEAIVFHCHGGINRSPAVAAAITESLGGNPQPFFQKRNPDLPIYNRLRRHEKNQKRLHGH